MADNIDVKDAAGATKTIAAKDKNSALHQFATAISEQVLVSANFTRPSDTNAYATGDVVCNSTSSPTIMTFANALRHNGGSGFLNEVILVDGACQATPALLELWLFSAAPTMDNDNAVFTPSDSELESLIAIVSLSMYFSGDATAGAGGNRVYTSGDMYKSIKAGASTTSIYGILVVRNAYTPVSAETFYVALKVIQD